jgi:small subunit ribosomal protein S5
VVSSLRKSQKIDAAALTLTERVVNVRRVSKVVAGGRRMRFAALVVVGDQEGHVGFGIGKAAAVPDAVRKGAVVARKNLVSITMRGTTIPHAVTTKFRASRVVMKPAPPGTGVIAGNSVRAVLEMGGITDIVTKALGSTNPVNVIPATFKALAQLRTPDSR